LCDFLPFYRDIRAGKSQHYDKIENDSVDRLQMNEQKKEDGSDLSKRKYDENDENGKKYGEIRN
jgi:hypothetical protein